MIVVGYQSKENSRMTWITPTADFLLSEWLWNITWGWYHIPVNVFMMLFLLKFFGRMRIMPAVLCSVFSQVFSFVGFSALVLAGPIYLLGLEFVPYDCYTHELMHPLLICLSLGAIYFVFHALFFALFSRFLKINMRLAILISLVANGLTALLVYNYWSYSFL